MEQISRRNRPPGGTKLLFSDPWQGSEQQGEQQFCAVASLVNFGASWTWWHQTQGMIRPSWVEIMQAITLEEEHQHMPPEQKLKTLPFLLLIRVRKWTWFNCRWEWLFEARRQVWKSWNHSLENKTSGFLGGFAQSWKVPTGTEMSQHKKECPGKV